MPIPYEFVGYSLGKWWGDLTFKILNAFLFYYCVHSANINKKIVFFFGGGDIFNVY